MLSLVVSSRRAHAFTNGRILSWGTFFGRRQQYASKAAATAIRPRATSLYARRPLDRRYSYTVEDLRSRGDRPFPPSFDSQEEDEGFGAYDYKPDIYDLEDMRQQESLAASVLEGEAPLSETPKDSPLSMPNVAAETDATNSKEASSSPPSMLFESVEDVPTHVHAAQVAEPAPDLQGFLVRAAYGTGATSDLDMLQLKLQELAEEIYKQNNGKEFNLNSPRQAAAVLFGPAGGSTKKDILEGMAAGGNRMADLILQYRSLQQQIKRATRRQELAQKGTRVRSASTVVRNATVEGSADPLLLVDASAYIFRAYYSMPPIHRSDGMPTGAVLGFCNMLNKLILNRLLDGERPRLVLVFDAKGKTFRHDLYSQYKANRATAPVDLIPQFDLVREAAKAYGICQIEAPNYEADDVIATLATMAIDEGIDANILSGDKDLMQLVTEQDAEPSIHMIEPMNMERYTYSEVVEKWGVPPDKLGDVLALAGDASDNVPGVPGVGPKIAAALIGEFDSLENLLEHVDDVKQNGRRGKLKAHQEQARLSRVLVDLERHVPMEKMTFPEGISHVRDIRMDVIDGDRILAFYDQMGFRDLKNRVNSRLQGLKAKRSRSNNRYKRPKAEIPKPEDYSDVPF